MSTSVQRLRHREHREQTRRQILAAADRQLRDRPYRELSVETVMTDAGLTRTAFYRHFEDVPDLVLRLLEDVGGELYEIAQKWRRGSAEDFPAAAREGLRAIVAFFERHGPLVAAVAEATVADQRIESGYQGFLEVFITLTERGFEGMVQRGQVEPFPTRAVARALNLMNERLLLDQLGREPRGEPADVLATIEMIWLRSVGAVEPTLP
ncbi:MAG: TetR/AcrR family transcriptional regulator [Solirubrobacteraceae bacterium]